MRHRRCRLQQLACGPGRRCVGSASLPCWPRRPAPCQPDGGTETRRRRLPRRAGERSEWPVRNADTADSSEPGAMGAPASRRAPRSAAQRGEPRYSCPAERLRPAATGNGDLKMGEADKIKTDKIKDLFLRANQTAAQFDPEARERILGQLALKASDDPRFREALRRNPDQVVESEAARLNIKASPEDLKDVGEKAREIASRAAPDAA